MGDRWKQYVPPDRPEPRRDRGFLYGMLLILAVYGGLFAWLVIYDADRHNRSEAHRARLQKEILAAGAARVEIARRIDDGRAEREALRRRIEAIEARLAAPPPK